ncbi:MAG: hypothetical protein M1537_03935 [Nitrospirae bacterium]|nr:hypothetical protein [Nitrospirota bacterium]
MIFLNGFWKRNLHFLRTGILAGGALLFLSSCASFSKSIPTVSEPGTLYRTSMMDAAVYSRLLVSSIECTPRYLNVRGVVEGQKPNSGQILRVRIEKNWGPGFDLSRKRAVLPLSAVIEIRKDDHWSRRTVHGFVEFRDLSACRIRRAAFVPSDDSSVLEPPLWIMDVAPSPRGFWRPRLVILNAYRALLNETISVVGPVPFRTPGHFYHPVSLVNGVVQRKDLLRGVSPPDFSGRLRATLWLKGKDQELKIIGSGNSGLFELRSDHTRGVGIFLPYPKPFYRFPARRYRMALAGSLLVDGPFAFEGRLDFDRAGQTVSLSGRINEAGAVVSDYQAQVPYRIGGATRFALPGEVDFSFSFNHRRVDLVMLPDANRRVYWLGALNQNLLGMADPT